MKKPGLKSPEIITKTEAARRLRITPSMITKYIREPKYAMPSRTDGRLDWEAVEAWHKDRIHPSRSGSYRARTLRKADAPVTRPLANFLGQPISSFSDDEAVRLQAHAEISAELTSAKAQKDFFMVCLEYMGVSAQQAYLIANWYAQVVLHALDVEDLSGSPDWKEFVGIDASVDMAECEAAYDAIADIECRPENNR